MVEAEWDSFLQDLRSGNRQGEMFILACGKLSRSDLPLFLRCQQIFSVDDLNKFVKSVTSAMPARSSLHDFIRASLHCFHPEKDEDKIHLLTVHPGNNADTFHVTAYWGSRTAKRLSSQMKAINVSAKVAALEVKKATREKLLKGYVQKPATKILMIEARSHMSAALGFQGVPGKVRSPIAPPSKPDLLSKHRERKRNR